MSARIAASGFDTDFMDSTKKRFSLTWRVAKFHLTATYQAILILPCRESREYTTGRGTRAIVINSQKRKVCTRFSFRRFINAFKSYTSVSKGIPKGEASARGRSILLPSVSIRARVFSSDYKSFKPYNFFLFALFRNDDEIYIAVVGIIIFPAMLPHLWSAYARKGLIWNAEGCGVPTGRLQVRRRRRLAAI